MSTNDEFTHYVTDATIRIVILLRKCALGLVLATQTLKGNPKTEGIINLALQAVDNLISFRVSHGDAEVLAPEFFQPSIDQVKDIHIRSAFTYDRVWRPLPEILEQSIRMITTLPDRTFFWKRRGHPGARRIESLPVADIKDLPDTANLQKLLKLQEIAASKLAGVDKRAGMWAGPQKPLLLLPGPTSGQSPDVDDDDFDYDQFFDQT